MTSRLPKADGFTLIELMMVIAIIGTLAAIAIPRFANAFKSANEGATKGNLAVMRSAISIYYADTEGVFPTDLTPLTAPGSKYLNKTMKVTTAYHGSIGAIVYVSAVDSSDIGGWAYVNSGTDLGKIYIQCTHTDSKGTAWNQY